MVCSLPGSMVFPYSSPLTVMSVTSLLTSRSLTPLLTSSRQINCNRAAIAKIRRNTYKRMYPTMLVLANGSTISIRYHEPRQIIKFPLDLSTLSEDMRLARLGRRNPKTKLVVEDDLDVSFTPDSYSQFWKQ